MEESDKQWVTVYPDYPRTFAWLRKPIAASHLDTGVGGDFGFSDLDDGSAELGDDVLPNELAARISRWMDDWGKIEDRLRDFDSEEDYEAALKDGKAVDAEGLEITKELKKLYGYKYRFRYSYAWNSTWVIV